MTHLDIYQCDRQRCREEKPAEYLPATAGGVSGPLPPPGWLELDRRRYGDFPKHFCSLACLTIWARAERAVVSLMEGK